MASCGNVKIDVRARTHGKPSGQRTSGRQAGRGGWPTEMPTACGVRRSSPVPSEFITYVPYRLVDIAIFFPSGDQTGGPLMPTEAPARNGGRGDNSLPFGETNSI